MKTLTLFIQAELMILICLLFSSGCNDSTVQTQNPQSSDPGILRTDEFGNILGGDTTDWCLNEPAGFSFGPAYPNPTRGATVRVKFSVVVTDTVKIYFLSPSLDTTEFFSGPVMPGNYEITIDGTQYLGTYQRAYFGSKQYSPSAFCRFFGDIKFEP